MTHCHSPLVAQYLLENPGSGWLFEGNFGNFSNIHLNMSRSAISLRRFQVRNRSNFGRGHFFQG